MNLQNINIENKTEEQFAIMVRKLMKQVTDFIERGENELGFKIDYMTAINIEDSTGGGIHSLQTMKAGHNLLEQSIFDDEGEPTALFQLAHIILREMVDDVIEIDLDNLSDEDL
ncbi:MULTISPECIES: hypothetical protein [unclassified Staphylococcus]|uniref:hypothetical protein n=1 Tax=unclassified Staphylococcus TaxID=91994 RepID=UPI00122E58D1|nr:MULTISPECIES: hypothetical protein [unclassified Staphylococcus]KAA2278073.1 hypothetical protein F1592_00690 [Staphylococcus sp. GDX7P312P]KAA2281490.1 hypothetical protein F1591_03315 [Staphylococcus sp. GDX7P459A]